MRVNVAETGFVGATLSGKVVESGGGLSPDRVAVKNLRENRNSSQLISVFGAPPKFCVCAKQGKR